MIMIVVVIMMVVVMPAGRVFHLVFTGGTKPRFLGE